MGLLWYGVFSDGRISAVGCHVRRTAEAASQRFGGLCGISGSMQPPGRILDQGENRGTDSGFPSETPANLAAMAIGRHCNGERTQIQPVTNGEKAVFSVEVSRGACPVGDSTGEAGEGFPLTGGLFRDILKKIFFEVMI